MLKKILTVLGVFVSSISFSQSATNNDINGSVSDTDAEINAICDRYLGDDEGYKECVEIVTIGFTTIPHNDGGVKQCPGGGKCSQTPDMEK